MERRIHISGIGRVSQSPDLIEINIDIIESEYKYESTMEKVANSLALIQNAIIEAGFEKKDLKTSDFRINTKYESYRDSDDNYREKFIGYECRHKMRIEFDFDNEKLGDLLNAITNSSVNPKFDIQFTIKDKESIKEKMLVNAAKDARNKAEILTEASGAVLGDLVNIKYDWDELYIYSDTSFDMLESSRIMEESMEMMPEDIEVSDRVSFVWEIK